MTKCLLWPMMSAPFYFLFGRFLVHMEWISGMPAGPYIYASDLNEVLKKKHASGTYKSLVSSLVIIIFLFFFVSIPVWAV